MDNGHKTLQKWDQTQGMKHSIQVLQGMAKHHLSLPAVAGKQSSASFSAAQIGVNIKSGAAVQLKTSIELESGTS